MKKNKTPQSVLDKKKEYYRKNAEAAKAYAKANRKPYGELSEEQKEKARAHSRVTSKQAYEDRASALYQRKRELARQHPEAAMLSRSRKSAKERGLDFCIDLTDIIIPECCPIFKIPLIVGTKTEKGQASDNTPTLDRIDNSKGYIKGNVWVVSWRANRLKSDATLAELRMIVAALESKLETPVSTHSQEERA